MRVFVVAGLGLAGILTASGVILGVLGSPGAGTAAAEVGTPSVVSSGNAAAPSGAAADPATGTGAAADGTAPSTGSPADGTPAPDTGLEMPSATPSENTLPAPKTPAPAMSGKVPKNASAEDKLVSGFPKKAVPLPAEAAVLTSSVSSSGRRVQVGLEARTTLTVDELLDHYQASFAARGWSVSTGSDVAGDRSVTGGYGDDSVTVSARQAPTGATLYSAFGTFTVAKK